MKSRNFFACGIFAVACALMLGVRNARSQKPAALVKIAPAKAGPVAREFSMVNVEYEGTKIWLPSLLVVKKSERVRIQLINNVPSGEHGFSIAEFNVVEKIFKGETRTAEFTADKAGLFKMFCQLHPKHIGGQILVLE